MQVLLLIAGSVLLWAILKRKRRSRQRNARRTVTTRTVSARNVKLPDPVKLERDATRRRIQYERERQKADRLQLIRTQASADLEHLQQRRRDLLKAYNMIPDADTEKNIRKRIQYDNAIRQTDRQIETARYNMNRTY